MAKVKCQPQNAQKEFKVQPEVDQGHVDICQLEVGFIYKSHRELCQRSFGNVILNRNSFEVSQK